MAYGIRAIAFADGTICPHSGQWMKSFDHEAFGGQGYGEFTHDPAKAMRFEKVTDAMAFWGRQSKIKALRPDGQPNKPMTALTAAIDPLP